MARGSAARFYAFGCSSTRALYGTHASLHIMRVRAKPVLIGSVVVIVLGAVALSSPWIYALGAGTLWDRAEPEVHLLPDGFIGPVVIVLEDSTAAIPEREHGARLFRISDGGVARSRLPVNDGWGRP